MPVPNARGETEPRDDLGDEESSEDSSCPAKEVATIVFRAFNREIIELAAASIALPLTALVLLVRHVIGSYSISQLGIVVFYVRSTIIPAHAHSSRVLPC